MVHFVLNRPRSIDWKRFRNSTRSGYGFGQKETRFAWKW